MTKNILFVCTGNTCRSPMAAALMDKIAVERNLDIRIDSAGVYAMEGEKASADAVRAVEEMGAELSNHYSKPITRELLNASDIILAMTRSHADILKPIVGDKVMTLGEYAGEDIDIPDPYGLGIDEYRKCAGVIYKLLLKSADRIEKEL